MEGDRHFHLYLISIYTILYFFIWELYQNAKFQSEDTRVKYSKVDLLSLKHKAHTTRISTEVCSHIKNLRIKQNFGRKRGGQAKQRTWDSNNEIHHNLLKPLNRLDKTSWNSTNLNMALINIQSLKPKLDMLIHHMQLYNLDICFITETWTQSGNGPDYQYIRANLDTAGYNIIIHSRDNRRGEGIAVIHRPHLHIKKLSFNENRSFEAITINLSITTKSFLLSTIYRAPYSSKQQVTMVTFL